MNVTGLYGIFGCVLVQRSLIPRFDLILYPSEDLSEARRSLKGFLSMDLRCRVITVLLNFRPVFRYISENQKRNFDLNFCL